MGYLSVEGELNLLPFSSFFHSILEASYTILSATLNGNEDLLKIGPQNYKHDISPISSYYMPPIIYFMALQSNRKSVKIYNHFLLLSLLSFSSGVPFQPPHVIMIAKSQTLQCEHKTRAVLGNNFRLD